MEKVGWLGSRVERDGLVRQEFERRKAEINSGDSPIGRGEVFSIGIEKFKEGDLAGSQ